jgi:glutamate/tyrosine decarboxylase-like PLP-dependent enzyme
MSADQSPPSRLLLEDVARRAIRYASEVRRRAVSPSPEDLRTLAELPRTLPEGSQDPAAVLAMLDEKGSPATVATTGGRYFGFVVGGVLPASLAATWLAAAWDQCAGVRALSPAAAEIEEIALRWVVDVLGLPPDTGAGFVTGATMANFTGLAAARHHLLARAGWDVEARGLYGAPTLEVVVGGEVHVSLLKALSLLGLGSERVVRVPVDEQGRMRAKALLPLGPRSILCIQAGNVNTGSFDPARELVAAARAAGAWVHVDGAFGLWALASPEKAALADGVAGADSWAVDAHKWLNVPYDSGLALCRDSLALRAAMAVSAAYLVTTPGREPDAFTPEMSRRARGVEVWAALASLGRSGLAHLVERTCRHARRFAAGLEEAGHEILNDVVLNQVLVRFRDDETTRRVIAALQEDGTCWCGGTVWQGRTAMRIAVSSWATTDEDVERSLAAMCRIASQIAAPGPSSIRW